jgi:hypothetical protein
MGGDRGDCECGPPARRTRQGEVGEVALSGLEARQVAAIDGLDKRRGAVRRFGHNGMAPASAAATKSASTRV